jgi:VCBS repeat-containing protein
MRSRHSWFVLAAVALGLAFPASVLADAPTADNLSPTTLEDTLKTITLVGDDADGDPLTFSIATGPSAGQLGTIGSVTCNGSPSHCTADVNYTPNSNASGADSFTYVSNDGTIDSGVATVSITVTPVNDQPSFTDGGSKTVLEDSGAASYSGWASGISRGGGSDESGQVIHFDVSNVATPSLFSAGPAVSAAGTLTFTPAANANGSSTLDVNAVDDGGTANSGDDTSIVHTITITVTAVNDVPTFTAGSDEVWTEDGGASSYNGWVTSADAGASNESGQILSYVITSNDHPAFFSAGPVVASNGTMSFTPASNANGVATIGVAIRDNGGTGNGGVDQSAAQTFTITLTAVNDSPTPQNDFPTVQMNAPATAIAVLANDNSTNPDGVETLTIISTNVTGTAGTVVITGGGTGLTYQPPVGFTGTDTFKYTVQDPGTLTGQATVLVTVGADTTAPVATAPVTTIRTGVSTSSTVAVHTAWSATDTGVGVGRYLVQRSVDGGAYATVTLPTALTTAVNQSLTVGHTYQYRLRAYDKNGNFTALKYGPKFLVSRIENTSTKVVFAAGGWATVSNVNDSGGSARYTYTANATATMTLSGRDFAIVGPKNSFRGAAWVYVDGLFVASITEHTTSSTTLYRQVLWSTHFATAGTHTIQIVVSGSGRFDVDAFLALR